MTIIDAHTHIRDTVDGHAPLYALAERLGYEKLSVMSLQCYDPLQNIACAVCKLKHPGMTYAFGGLDYITGRDFKTQAERLYAMGFDGIKMLEGKPTTRRTLHKALDDPEYDAFYDFLEETGFPVLLHVADPDTFWDRERAPGWAVEQGWLYDENDVPYEQYYREVENMLRKHPRLRAVFAHFYFLSWNPECAQRFLDDHPLVSLDVTAGIEMYEDFSKDPAFWRAFFIKNQDRIIFGTDSTDEPPAENADEEKVALNGYAGMEITFLSSGQDIEIYGMKLRGLDLPEEAQARIFAENFIKLAGKTPRKMDINLLREEAAFLRRFVAMDEIYSALLSIEA